MAGIPKEHNELYFDKLCRTQKAETVFSLIQATYHAKKSVKNEDNIKEEIAKRLKSAYELYRDNVRGTDSGAGSYSGSEEQFDSQYTIGHELCIWKNSKLDLTDLAYKVAVHEITIKDYFDIFFYNYFQPINNKAVHPLYLILSHMEENDIKEINKSSLPEILGVFASNENINALCNFLDGSNYIKYDGNKLIYVGEKTLIQTISKCNIKYLGVDGYALAKEELNTDEKYALYITSEIKINEDELEKSEDTTEVVSDDYSIDELAQYLKDMYNELSPKPLGIHLFGIKFGRVIKKNKYNLKDLIQKACLEESYEKELRKGVVLSSYAKIRNKFIPTYWLCSANSAIYDHDSAFHTNGLVDWADKHFKKANIGDIVFIYSTSPTKRVKFKCKITKKEITKADKVSDVQYWTNPIQDDEYEGLYIRFELLKESDDDRLTYDNLLKMGLKSAPQGAMKLDDEYLLLAHYIDAIFEEVDTQELTDEINSFISDFEIKGKAKNLVVFGTPGCGKSYYVNNTLLKDYPNMTDNTKERVIRTTFFQDYTYTDFVGQILPYIEYDVNNENGKKEERVTYKFTPGPFALALKEAVLNRDKDVVLVIEELNRGNAPAIFGDIFQLLDRNQYGISEYAITNIHLKDWLNSEIKGANFNKIKIPGNLNIFATMNTSDQNVFTLDTAFKRRWKFEKISNKFEDYKELYGEEHPFKDDFIPGMVETWKEFVDTINNAILEETDITKSEDKQIGIFFIDETGLVKKELLDLDENKKEKAKEFAYKIFEYLWDDVLKYCRENWFGKDIKSLDALIKKYLDNVDNNKGDEVFENGIFKKDK